MSSSTAPTGAPLKSIHSPGALPCPLCSQGASLSLSINTQPLPSFLHITLGTKAKDFAPPWFWRVLLLCLWPLTSTLLLALLDVKAVPAPWLLLAESLWGCLQDASVLIYSCSSPGSAPAQRTPPALSSDTDMPVHPSWFANRVSVVFSPSCWRLILAFMECEP